MNQLISTHTLTWSVTCSIKIEHLRSAFQLTRSRGAWHAAFLMRFKVLAFQLTRSRGAWLRWLSDVIIWCWFQLTRSRGAWPLLGFVTVFECCNFNSHAHVERDDRICNWYSIQNSFQLTRSRGAWLKQPKSLQQEVTFQLTRSRGAWPPWDSHLMPSMYFNSHAHVERDKIVLDLDKLVGISTHTLTWSVTIETTGLNRYKDISTHTLTWSVTSFNQLPLQLEEISTHTLTWSVTKIVKNRRCSLVFQLTRSRGAWQDLDF